MNTISYRPVTMDDGIKIAKLLSLRDAKFFGEERNWEATIASDLGGKGFDLASSSRLAVTNDGTVAAFEIVYDHFNPLRANLWGYVNRDFQGQGIGTEQLRWAEERASRNIAKAPRGAQVSVAASVFVQDSAGAKLLTDRGYSYIRSFYTMQLDFKEAPEITPIPDGFRLVSFAEQPDLRAFVTVDSAAFRDHWGHIDTPLEKEIAHWQDEIDTTPGFDPSMWWLAYYGDDPAGVIMTTPSCSIGAQIAWVDSLGVLKEYRKRGLGAALLSQAINGYYAQGRAGIALGVDASSMTNAVALYERAGMRVIMHRNVYEKVLREGTDISAH